MHLRKLTLVLVEQHKEGISSGGHVGLLGQHGGDELGTVGDQRLAVELVRMEDAEGGIFPHVRVTVFQAGLDAGDERAENLLVVHLAKEAEHRPPNVLVGVVQIVHKGVAHQDHLREELPGRGLTSGLLRRELLLGGRLLVLGHDLPVQHAQLLQGLVVGIDAEPDDLHEDAGHGLTAQHGHDGRLEGVPFDLGVGVLQVLGDFLLGREAPGRHIGGQGERAVRLVAVHRSRHAGLIVCCSSRWPPRCFADKQCRSDTKNAAGAGTTTVTTSATAALVQALCTFNAKKHACAIAFIPTIGTPPLTAALLLRCCSAT